MNPFRQIRTLSWAATAAGVLFTCLTASADDAQNRLRVHEWGTFTTLQNEHGRDIPGVNVDDEPVPAFVHNLSPYVLSAPLLTNDYWAYRMKGAPRRHPFVRMRLETPVIYFYPPADAELPMSVDVRVAYRGGWLTEFYPRAAADAPGLGEGRFRFGYLSEDTVGSLKWKDLGTTASGPATDEHVWTAPRRVASAGVTTTEGESEQYLFYRGVGQMGAPLRIKTDLAHDELQIHSSLSEVLPPGETVRIASLWLVDVRHDGATAFRRIGPLDATASGKPVLAKLDAQFAEEDYRAENRDRLQEEMHAALVAEGLFPDEATAMLSTWRRAYFESPGRRVFFPVPRPWTDHYLPLSVSTSPADSANAALASHPVETERVMMCRIELISPKQRRLLAELSRSEVGFATWLQSIPESHEAQKQMLLAGRTDFGDLGVPIPPEYQMYIDLGRFRNALLIHEEKRRPSTSLSQFIDRYGLHFYRW